MTLKPLGPNQTVLSIGDGEVFYSYQTPVAGFVPGLGWIRTATTYSVTTSRHVNGYLANTVGKVTVLQQAEFDKVINSLGGAK